MTNSDVFPFLRQDRAHTDNSLTTERGKADESLLDLRRQAETETDEKVKMGRQDADLVREQSRNNTDLAHALSGRTSEQRQVDDKAMQAERSSMDAALKQERIQKEAVLNRFLHEEREETDDNLLRERQRTDSEVKRSKKLFTDETTSHSKTKAQLTTRDEFMAIVSHDLRNPIGAVLTCADMLLEHPSSEGVGSDARYWIQFMKRNAENALRLINDLLDIERMSQGKMQLQPTMNSLRDVVLQSAECFIHVAANKGISLTVLPSEVIEPIPFDRDRISQVITNLLGNAIKFTPEGGSVTIGLERVGKKQKVLVTDTGAGVSEEQQLKIFDRFAQINNKDRRGLGLGLYIAKTLIEAHHGTLMVESSALGKGSIFSFTLPNQDSV